MQTYDPRLHVCLSQQEFNLKVCSSHQWHIATYTYTDTSNQWYLQSVLFSAFRVSTLYGIFDRVSVVVTIVPSYSYLCKMHCT